MPDPTTAHGWTAPTVSDDDFPVPERDCPCPAAARLGEARTLARRYADAADAPGRDAADAADDLLLALLALLWEDTP